MTAPRAYAAPNRAQSTRIVPRPLGLGANLYTLIVLHAIYASVVAGSIALVAGRFMRFPAAVGAAVFLALAPGWIELARVPLTEITSVLCILVVLVTSRGVLRSARGINRAVARVLDDDIECFRKAVAQLEHVDLLDVVRVDGEVVAGRVVAVLPKQQHVVSGTAAG